MKKLMLIIAIATMLAVILCGCACDCERKVDTIAVWKMCGYIEREGDLDLVVYYDENTRVMYASNSYGKTVLLNSDGTPMLWEGGEE